MAMTVEQAKGRRQRLMSDTSGKGPETQGTGGAGSEAPKPSPARPRPPVIDLEAKPVKPATSGTGPSAANPATPPPAPAAKAASGSTAKPSPSSSPASSTQTGSTAQRAEIPGAQKEKAASLSTLAPLIAAGLGGAALATFVVISLGAAGLLPSANDRRIATLESDLARLQDGLATAGRPQADPRVGGLEQQLADLDARITAAAETSRAQASGDVTAAMSRTETRARNLETRTNELDARLERLSREQSENESELTQRIEKLETFRSDATGTAPANTGRAAVALSVAAALDAALMRGQPYGEELATVRALLPSSDIGSLADFAETGLPTAPAIAARWRIAVKAAPPPPPSADAGILDRLLVNARSLVRVTPLGEPQGDTPAEIHARFLAALERADLPLALSLWNGFDASVKSATQEPARLAQARTEAEKTAVSLRTSALSVARATVSQQ